MARGRNAAHPSCHVPASLRWRWWCLPATAAGRLGVLGPGRAWVLGRESDSSRVCGRSRSQAARPPGQEVPRPRASEHSPKRCSLSLLRSELSPALSCSHRLSPALTTGRGPGDTQDRPPPWAAHRGVLGLWLLTCPCPWRPRATHPCIEGFGQLLGRLGPQWRRRLKGQVPLFAGRRRSLGNLGMVVARRPTFSSLPQHGPGGWLQSRPPPSPPARGEPHGSAAGGAGCGLRSQGFFSPSWHVLRAL